MANGLNGILGGFETSRHVLIKRGFIRQYLVALGMSLLLSLLLLVTVAIIVVFEVLIVVFSIVSTFYVFNCLAMISYSIIADC